jgi:hypothetical protein
MSFGFHPQHAASASVFPSSHLQPPLPFPGIQAPRRISLPLLLPSQAAFTRSFVFMHLRIATLCNSPRITTLRKTGGMCSLPKGKHDSTSGRVLAGPIQWSKGDLSVFSLLSLSPLRPYPLLSARSGKVLDKCGSKPLLCGRKLPHFTLKQLATLCQQKLCPGSSRSDVVAKMRFPWRTQFSADFAAPGEGHGNSQMAVDLW